MSLRKLISIIASLFIFGQTFAQSPSNESSDFSKASVSIKYYNKNIYYPGTAEESPVFVHIAIKNNGTETLRFKLADDRMFSLDFNAYTVKNSRLDQTVNLIEKRTTNQTVFFREISLE